jgi:hypothetical protein
VLVVVAAIHHHIMFQMSRTIQELKNREMKGRQMENTGKRDFCNQERNKSKKESSS